MHSLINSMHLSKKKIHAYLFAHVSLCECVQLKKREGKGRKIFSFKDIRKFLESNGLRSLAGYSPWDHKESDTAERLTLQFTSCLLRAQIQKWKLAQESMSGQENLTFLEAQCDSSESRYSGRTQPKGDPYTFVSLTQGLLLCSPHKYQRKKKISSFQIGKGNVGILNYDYILSFS